MNTDEIETLRDGLRDLADQPYDLGRTDVAQARTSGRRTLLLRRATAATASAVALTTTAAAVIAVAPPGGLSIGDGPAGATHRNAPLMEKAAFTWLPPGYHTTVVTQDGEVSILDARDSGNSLYSLTVQATGDPTPGVAGTSSNSADNTSTAPIGGRPARWMRAPTSKGASLLFQVGKARWATLGLGDPPRGTNVADTIRRVAEGVRLVSRPVPFPFQVRGIPKSILKHSAASFVTTYRRFDPGWVAELGLGRSMFIQVTPGSTFDRAGRGVAPPNTSLDGHPAFSSLYTRKNALVSPFYFNDTVIADETGLPPYVPDKAGSETLCVYENHGLTICLMATGDALTQVKAAGGLTGLYRNTTFFGSDPAKWTIYPLG